MTSGPLLGRPTRRGGAATIWYQRGVAGLVALMATAASLLALAALDRRPLAAEPSATMPAVVFTPLDLASRDTLLPPLPAAARPLAPATRGVPAPLPAPAPRTMPAVPTALLSTLDDVLPELLADERQGLGDLAFGEAMVDEPPRPLRRGAPLYPERARQRQVSGVVTVRLKLSAAGQVEQARVVAAEPPGWFEEAALAAVRQWRFAPARYRGRAVAVWATQRIDFELE